MRTLECMNDRSGRRDITAAASADSGSVVVPSFIVDVLARDGFDVVADDVMAFRIESSGVERDLVFWVGNSNTSSSSFSCFLTTINIHYYTTPIYGLFSWTTWISQVTER